MSEQENLNKSQESSWVDMAFKRFKGNGIMVPKTQMAFYKKLSEHWASGKTIIDVGCATGWGSNVLAHYARHVWGVDINEEAIRFANHIYARPNLSFEVMDIESPPIRELAPFEIVVCSEVIEHLDDPLVGIAFIKRFFDPKLNTVGFITAPNRNNSRTKLKDDQNKYHISHWTAGEFYALLTQHFRSVTLFNSDCLDKWLPEETMDGNGTGAITIAKVEGVK